MRNKLRILMDARRRRRQVLLVLTLVISAVHFGADVRPRQAWSLPRPQGWFNLMCPFTTTTPTGASTSECLDEHFSS